MDQVRQLREALARTPGDAAVLRRFCFSCARHFNDAVVETLADRLSQPGAEPSFRADELLLYAHARERQERQRRGLPLTNGASLADTRFQFADQELADVEVAAVTLLKENPKFLAAGVILGDALVSRGRIVQAERIFSQFRAAKTKGSEGVTWLDPAFHETLPALAREALRQDLPPLAAIRPFEGRPRRFIFAAGDYRYFQKFGWPLISSFRAQQPGDIGLALHVMDMTADEGVELAGKLETSLHDWSLTTEWTGLRTPESNQAAREYYHAIRFARFFELLEIHPQAAAWLVDMDDLFNGSPVALFDLLGDADVSAVVTPARLETRNKIAAHMIGIGATALGRAFIARTAGYVAACRAAGRLPWGIDQVALYAVLAVLMGTSSQPAFVAVPPQIYDGSHGQYRILWSGKGSARSPDYPRVEALVSRWCDEFGPST